MDQNIKLHIKDKTFAHCEFSNNPMPPKQFSKHITWVRDREPSIDDWCVYTDLCLEEARPYAFKGEFLDSRGLPPGSIVVDKDDPSPDNKNIAWLIEPYDHIPHIYQWLRDNHERFAQIWTHDWELLMYGNGVNTMWKPGEPYEHRCMNKGLLIPFGGCWIDKEHQVIPKKTKDFSIIASGKMQHQGHKLRHSIIASAAGRVDTFGGGYNPIQDKIEGLRDYRYHFVIENVRRDFWFTEKLIDCFITGTIPIFWGCPSINNFFNTQGMKIFEHITDLPSLLKQCTAEEYNKMLPHIEENFELAKNYILAEDYIYSNYNKFLT